MMDDDPYTQRSVEAVNEQVLGIAAAQGAAAEEFGEWLMGCADLRELPTLISWLEGTSPKAVIACLREIAAAFEIKRSLKGQP